MYLRRFKHSDKIPANYDYSFRNRIDSCDGWIVAALTREGDAAKADIVLGDTIISINGESTKDFTWEEENRVNTAPTKC